MRLGPLEIRLRLRRRQAEGPRFSSSLFPWAFLPDAPEVRPGDEGAADAYQLELWVYRCVSIVAMHCAEAIPRLHRVLPDGTREPIPESPLLDLLRDVNPYSMNYRSLMVATVSSLLLWGNAYWLLDGRQRPEAIYWLPPQSVTPVPDPVRLVAGYDWRVNGQLVRLPSERVVHFRFFNPRSQVLGLSPISAARLDINLSLSAKHYNRAFFRNMARLGGVFVTDQPLSDEQREMLVQQLRSALTGAENAFRWLVAEAGIKPQPMAIPPKDAEFVQQMELSRIDICAIFGVPPTVAGASQAANYATAREEGRWFLEYTVRPLLGFLAEELTWSLVPFFAPENEMWELTFDASPIERKLEDPSARHQMVREDFKAGLLTLNEARRELYPHLPELADGDVLLLPATLVPTPAEVREARAPRLVAARAVPALVDTTAEFGSPAHEVRWRGFAQRAEGHERAFAQRLRREFKRQQEETLRNLRKVLGQKRGPDPDLLASLIFDLDEQVTVWLRLLGPILRSIVEDEGDWVAEELGVEFNPSHSRVRDFLFERQRHLARVVNETTFQQIKEALAEGIREGEGTDKLAERVEQVFAFASRVRAERIARTETIGASNFAHVEAYRQSGLVEMKRWIAALDERTRDTHREAHGQEVPVDAPFSVGGHALMFPGDPDGPPEEVINCRCTVAPVLKGGRR